MLVFLRCDFIQSISFLQIIATRETKTSSLCISFLFLHFFSNLVALSLSLSLPISLCFPFPFCFLIPFSFYLQFIASDSKFPSNITIMIAAMIPPVLGILPWRMPQGVGSIRYPSHKPSSQRIRVWKLFVLL